MPNNTIKPTGSGGREAAPGPVLYLNSDNSNEVCLTASQRKVAYALQENVKALAAEYGIGRLGFLTLTFSSNVQCMKEAQRRYNSLATGVLRKRYEKTICVVERQARGAVHFHVLVVCNNDIRNGADLEQIRAGNYRSANKFLRHEWAFWNPKIGATAKAYKFGRTEMLPVKSTAEAIGRYMGKYMAKHIGCRPVSDKGARLVRYSFGAARYSCRFAFNSVGSWLWRHKLKHFAGRLGSEDNTWIPEDLRRRLMARPDGPALVRRWYKNRTTVFAVRYGCRWAYKLKPMFDFFKLDFYPTSQHYNQDHPGALNPLPLGMVDISDSSDSWNYREAALRMFIYGAVSNLQESGQLSSREPRFNNEPF